MAIAAFSRGALRTDPRCEADSRYVRGTVPKQKLSQAELAERAGTKQPAIARLESGRVVPRLELLQKIADALGMRLEVRFVKHEEP
jgi:transcriptional regulator with XRE-family HTH domain